MAVRTACARWEGNLAGGKGTVSLGSETLEAPYSYRSRFENGAGTNPEELLAAAHAGCYSMALAYELSNAGYAPIRVETEAKVHLTKDGDGFRIPKVELVTEGDVPGIDPETFQHYAQSAKQNCPVSKLFAGAEIDLESHLLSIERV